MEQNQKSLCTFFSYAGRCWFCCRNKCSIPLCFSWKRNIVSQTKCSFFYFCWCFEKFLVFPCFYCFSSLFSLFFRKNELEITLGKWNSFLYNYSSKFQTHNIISSFPLPLFSNNLKTKNGSERVGDRVGPHEWPMTRNPTTTNTTISWWWSRWPSSPPSHWNP